MGSTYSVASEDERAFEERFREDERFREEQRALDEAWAREEERFREAERAREEQRAREEAIALKGFCDNESYLAAVNAATKKWHRTLSLAKRWGGDWRWKRHRKANSALLSLTRP